MYEIGLWRKNLAKSHKRTDGMVIIKSGKKYYEHKYHSEEKIEADVFMNSDILFGQNTAFIYVKGNPELRALSEIMPDGLLLVLSDQNHLSLYFVEVEISTNRFFEHIFPRVTRFLRLLKDIGRRRGFSKKIVSAIVSSPNLRGKLDVQIRNAILQRPRGDSFEVSPPIILIIDEEKVEFEETIQKYTDTWGKMVKIFVLKKFVHEKESIFCFGPEFKFQDHPDNKAIANGDELREIHQSGESPPARNEKTVNGRMATYSFSRKVSMTKSGGKTKGLGETSIGWEVAPPKEGERYRIYLENGKLRMTSRVKLIVETKDTVSIMTVNSLYDIKILETGSRVDPLILGKYEEVETR
jgi:hypothetical protein